MKPAAFEFSRVKNAREAATLLAAAAGDGRLLGGGQSLGPTLNLRLARPTRLIELKGAADLRDLAADGDRVSIGAGWTHAEIEDGVVEDPAGGLLQHVARAIAYRAVRNRGTLGGSLAHADPAADWVSTMAALGAVLVARRGDGTTVRYAADDFVLGAFTTRLGENEVLVAVEIRRLSPTGRWGYYKVCRKTGEFARAIGVALLDPARGLSRVLAGAVEGPPVLLPRTAARLAEAGVEAASDLIADELATLLPHLEAARRQVHVVAVARALRMLA